MKKLILLAIVAISFASCKNIFEETHTFVSRININGTIITNTKVVKSIDVPVPIGDLTLQN